MALPDQPASALEVIASQEFYRIFQQVQGPGDIFEIDSSAKAIYLGPDSDVSEITLTYFNGQAPRSTRTASLSTGAPFVGLLDSLLDQQYPGIGQQSRILASVSDIVDPDYIRPPSVIAFTPARRYNAPINIDLVTALKPLPSIPTIRPDRTYRLKVPMNNDSVPDTNDGSTDIVIPIYGRRMVTVITVTPAHVPHATFFYLAALPPGDSFPVAKVLGSFDTADSTDPLTESAVFRASDQVSSTSGLQSPSGQTTITEFLPLNSCKGMADLLIVNFVPNFGMSPPAGYSMLDVFIRVSDKEEG